MENCQIGALVFPGFELLDLFGPLEMFGMYPDVFDIQLIAQSGEPVASAQGPRTLPDQGFADGTLFDLLLVPGGSGTRIEVANPKILDWLRNQAASASIITSVCTGSALLAVAGLLDGRRATTNKNAFQWVSSQGPKVQWVKQARWVNDGPFYTSSGVSAGTDMSLAVIASLLGTGKAEQAAQWAEYHWNQDPNDDPFARLAGLLDDD